MRTVLLGSVALRRFGGSSAALRSKRPLRFLATAPTATSGFSYRSAVRRRSQRTCSKSSGHWGIRLRWAGGASLLLAAPQRSTALFLTRLVVVMCLWRMMSWRASKPGDERRK